MVNIVDLVKNYRSTRKNTFDSWVDPALFWTASNAAILLGGDRMLDLVSQKADTHEGALMLGAYVGLAATLGAANKYIINPVARRIHNMDRDEPATALSWLRSIATVAGIAALSAVGGIKQTYNNYAADTQRVVSAFSRDVALADAISADTTAVLPTTPLSNPRDPLLNTGSLAGHNVGRNIPDNFHSQYTTLTGVVPDAVPRINYAANLERLWDRKSDRGANGVAKATGEALVREYQARSPTLMSLDDYIRITDRNIAIVRDNADWSQIGRITTLGGRSLTLLRNIASRIDGKDMVSFAMTELFNGEDGQLNVATLDFLLRTAGREYFESIPALNDNITSFGPYQFTENAVFDTPTRREGASKINQALPPAHRMVGSVSQIRDDDHAKGVYLNAIYNLASLIRNAERSQLDVLERVATGRKSEIIQFIASAHNKPTRGVESAIRWLANGARQPYIVSTSNGVRGYATKTAANYAALHGGAVPHSDDTLPHAPRASTRTSRAPAQAQTPHAPVQEHTPAYVPFSPVRTMSAHGDIFKHIVRRGENLIVIARAFNTYDASNGDRYRDISAINIVDVHGSHLNTITPNQEVYVRARKKH